MTTARQFAGAVSRAAERLTVDDPDRVTLDDLRAILASRGVTTGDATDLLGVASKNTVKKLLESGKIEGATKTSGGHWRVPPDAILAYRTEQLRLRDSGSLKPAQARKRRVAFGVSTSR